MIEDSFLARDSEFHARRSSNEGMPTHNCKDFSRWYKGLGWRVRAEGLHLESGNCQWSWLGLLTAVLYRITACRWKGMFAHNVLSIAGDMYTSHLVISHLSHKCRASRLGINSSVHLATDPALHWWDCTGWNNQTVCYFTSCLWTWSKCRNFRYTMLVKHHHCWRRLTTRCIAIACHFSERDLYYAVQIPLLFL